MVMDQTSVDVEVGVGAPLRPDVSKVNVSITLVGGLLLGSPLGTEPFLVLFFSRLVYTLLSFLRIFRSQAPITMAILLSLSSRTIFGAPSPPK